MDVKAAIPRWEFNGLPGLHNHIQCLAAGKKDFGTSVAHKRLISQRRQTHKMHQSPSLKYNFVNCIIQTYHACISFEFNLGISWLFPRDVPCQEDVLSLLSCLIFIILILRQAWKSRTVVKSPSGFAESLWKLEKGLGKYNLQQIRSFQIRFSNITSLRETRQAVLLKSLQIYCCISDLTICMRCCLLALAVQDADALPSVVNWHQRGEQAPTKCCGSCGRWTISTW